MYRGTRLSPSGRRKGDLDVPFRILRHGDTPVHDLGPQRRILAAQGHQLGVPASR